MAPDPENEAQEASSKDVSESAETLKPQPRMDGGTVAWLQVLGCFFCWFNTWGLTNAFGVFQTYYETALPMQTPSQISWIGTLQSFILIFGSTLAGPLYDAGYYPYLITSGSLIICFGYMMTSLCTQYWQVMLAQGLVVGIGSSILFICAIVFIPQYFSRRRALANGIAAAGSSVGGVIYPIAFRGLLQHLSFGWSVRMLAFMVLGTQLVSVLLLRVRNKPLGKRGLSLDMHAFGELPFAAFTLGLFFAMSGLYIPTFYVESFASQTGALGPELAPYTLPILNAAGVAGRIIPNLVADRIGALNILAPCILGASIVTWAWIAVHDEGGMIAYSAIYGFFSGAILSLPSVVIANLTPDMSVIGARMGTSFGTAALGLLIGSPVAGAILASTGKYIGLQSYGASLLLVATAGMSLARVSKTGWKWKSRV